MDVHAVLEFLQLELLVEKTDIVEGFENLLELAGLVFDEFFKGFIAVYESEEGVIHDEVIKTELLFLFLLWGLWICFQEIFIVGYLP